MKPLPKLAGVIGSIASVGLLLKTALIACTVDGHLDWKCFLLTLAAGTAAAATTATAHSLPGTGGKPTP